MYNKTRLFALISIILLLLTGCQNNKNTSFSFRNGITWKSSVNDIRIAENSDGDYFAYDTGVSLSYEDVAVSHYTADDLIYYFENNELTAVRYFLRSDMSDEDISNIKKSLTEKYGKASAPDEQYCMNLMKASGLDNTMFMNEDRYSKYSNWKLSDGTLVATWTDKHYGYQILYLNGKALETSISMPNTAGL